MKVTVRHKQDMGDWYLIERAEHDGREWSEEFSYADGGGGSVYCLSARICGEGYGATPPGHTADVEGCGVEMLTIADAIELRGAVQFKRCGVDAREDPVLISSPRNGNGFDAKITHDEALDLARQIRATVNTLAP